MNDILKKAIEGGWNDRLYRNMRNAPENEKAGIETHYRDLVLDPLFWQALGKSCGWLSYQTDTYYMHFFLLNWNEGWDSAISYLTNLIKS